MLLTANDIKVKGVSVFADALEHAQEAFISVRGKNKYVVMDIERFQSLQALELDAAYAQAVKEVEAGEYKVLSALEHIKELQNVLQADSD